MNKRFFTAATLALLAASSTALAEGDVEAGKQAAAACAACHGMDGNSTDPQYPKIAGLGERYLVKQLREYQDQTRENAIMAGMVAALSEQDVENLAAYFASQARTEGVADAELVEAGQALYRGGDLDRQIAACTACHGPSGNGIPGAAFPGLAGQHQDYVAAQLKAFRVGARANDPQEMMRDIAVRLTDNDIRAISSYVQGLRE
jgi:cytochrome c553